MRFVDTLIPFGADVARIREGLDDLERRRTQVPTFQVNDGTSTFGVYDYLKLVNAGTLTASGNVVTLTQPIIDSGTYTPTLSHIANVASSTAYLTRYMRIGSIVHVSGKVLVDPTLATTTTGIGISLPIASDFTDNLQCSGTAGSTDTTTGRVGTIYGGTSGDNAVLEFYPAAATASSHFFVFTYIIA